MCSSPLRSGRTSPGSVRMSRDAVVETVRLDRDEQEVDGLLQPLRDLELLGVLAVVGHERQAFGGNRRRGLRPRHADDALAGERHADAERTPTAPGPRPRRLIPWPGR